MSSPPLIGRYRVERPLGSGSFALVWLAHDDDLEAPVAVKVMAENWAFRMDLRERFLTEARMLRAAASRRVVQVHDIGELPDGRPYFVMEYADEGTLETLLKAAGGPLPVAQGLRLAAEVARGVAALHEAGIVHRDIKPSNVLIGSARQNGRGGRGGQHRQDGRVLVADLGLAKSLAHASGLTMTAGSAGYMAPEQIDPGEGGIDERVDVYGLGALTYHLLTGTVPGPPGKQVRPRRLRPEITKGVERVIMRALAPDRRRRWPGALPFADALDALPNASRSSVRRLRRTLVATGAAVALAAGGTEMWLHRGTGDWEPGPTLLPVSDGTGRVTLSVPVAWSGGLRGAGWSPKAALGLSDSHQPGLVVARSLESWQDLSADVTGVFVGLNARGDLSAKVGGIAHRSCHYQGERTYAGATWHGRVRRWTGCAGGDRSVEEISLSRTGGGQPEVYVQIRQPDGSDATDRVLAGLRVTGS